MTEQANENAVLAEDQMVKAIGLPPQLQRISADILRIVLPDLSVSVVHAEHNAQVTHCHKVTFRVTLSPGTFRPAGNQAARVRVIDEVFGIPETVGEVLLFLPAAGGTTQASIEWPMPADAAWHPDFNNEITVIVNPDNEVAERNIGNNSVTVTGTCLG